MKISAKLLFVLFRWCAINGWIHYFGIVFGLSAVVGSFSFWCNVFGNVYPSIVQLYIGWRCLKVKAARYKSKLRELNKKGLHGNAARIQ